MAKRKRQTKGQTLIYKILHRKIEQHESHENQEWTRVFRNGHITLVINLVISHVKLIYPKVNQKKTNITNDSC